MMVNVEQIEAMYGKDANKAYAVLKELIEESKKSNAVYKYMSDISNMIYDDNSYVRMRGLILIAYNAKWDVDNKVDEIIDDYLKHIVDVKPIVSRKCIEVLPLIAEAKEDLRTDIINALLNADTSQYKDSMEPLVRKDITNAYKCICSY